MISLEIACFQYRYQRRTWWQLSSIADQVTNNLPLIRYTLNCHKDDPGKELTEKLKGTFESKINLEVRTWDNDSFFKRGYTRTSDLQKSISDFILFVDSDEVFHPEFFSSLTPLLEKWKADKNDKCIAAIRRTMEISDGNKLVDAESYEDVPIVNWHSKIEKVKTKVISGAKGSGGFQIFNMQILREKNLLEYGGNRDTPVNSVNKFITRSEIWFRSKMGVDSSFANLILPVYHLNHERGDERQVLLTKNPGYIF